MFCPKCHNGFIIKKQYGFGPEFNTSVCMICGCSHSKGSSPESVTRQVRGSLWINPRKVKTPPEVINVCQAAI